MRRLGYEQACKASNPSSFARLWDRAFGYDVMCAAVDCRRDSGGERPVGFSARCVTSTNGGFCAMDDIDGADSYAPAHDDPPALTRPHVPTSALMVLRAPSRHVF